MDDVFGDGQMINGGVALMAGPKRRPVETPEDIRVAAIVLKDTPKYRDWLTGLSDATLIPVATIVRDALSKWAADRNLPPPPSGSTKSQRKTGDRNPALKSKRPKRSTDA